MLIYISREKYFADVTKAKGSYLVRGSQNLNPKSTGSLPTGRQGNAQVTRKKLRISIGEAAEPRFWIWM